jgi:selenocysteine lyase/cysteine desulfurase
MIIYRNRYKKKEKKRKPEKDIARQIRERTKVVGVNKGNNMTGL